MVFNYLTHIATECENQPGTYSILERSPKGLVSLWELMKIFNPELGLTLFRVLPINLRTAKTAKTQAEARIMEAALQLFDSSLIGCLALCRAWELPIAASFVDDAIKLREFEGKSFINFEETERMVNNIAAVAEREMSHRFYLAIDPSKIQYYNEAKPFGDTVANAFPSTIYETTEAFKCYALGRNTACVFHLMRTLETGLVALAKQFGVDHSHTNWNTILEQIEKAVKDMGNSATKAPTWKDDQEYYSQCTINFFHFKNAWRNYTAHMRGKYDDQEAADIMTGVRAFMQKLALRLAE